MTPKKHDDEIKDPEDLAETLETNEELLEEGEDGVKKEDEVLDSEGRASLGLE